MQTDTLGRSRMFFLEALVITCSIAVAFSVDRWWDSHRNRMEERLTLAALHGEFTAARLELRTSKELHGRVDEAIRLSLATLVDAVQQGRAETLIADSVLAYVYIPPTTQLSLPTRSGLVAAGRLGLLQDAELRAALTNWEAVLEDLSEDEDRSRDFVDFQMDPVLRQRVDVTRFRTRSQSSHAGASSLPVDNELVGVLASRLNLQDHTMEEFSPVERELDRILELIDRSLERQ